MMPSASATALQHHRRLLRSVLKVIRRDPRASTYSFHTSRPVCTLNPKLSWDDRSASNDSKNGDGFNTLFRYSEKQSTPLPHKFAKLHARSEEHYPGTADKAVSSMQGQFLQLLMRMTRPRLVLELGCFMGYSAMAMADGMPEESVLYTCEVDSRAADLARDLFEREGYTEAGVKEKKQFTKIELLEGEAMKSLKTLAKNSLKFDVIFLDADKGNYINYFNFILDNDLLADHGYILADNTLFGGLVLNSPSQEDHTNRTSNMPSPPLSPPPRADKSSTEAKRLRRSQKVADYIDEFNRHVKNDLRVDVVLLPVFDGLSVIMKKNAKTPFNAQALTKTSLLNNTTKINESKIVPSLSNTPAAMGDHLLENSDVATTPVAKNGGQPMTVHPLDTTKPATRACALTNTISFEYQFFVNLTLACLTFWAIMTAFKDWKRTRRWICVMDDDSDLVVNTYFSEFRRAYSLPLIGASLVMIGSIMMALNLGSSPLWKLPRWAAALLDGSGYTSIVAGSFYFIIGVLPWEMREFRDSPFNL
ncbi:hypothetical protein BGX28_005752 [Mortierella sp. GBA30]|nr:hypothetical protein BGX28_005752 [Mortierella sp. GBA30]